MKGQARSVLREVFRKYQGHGLEAIYLWGSILTPDFDPHTSDVDSIGIADDRCPFHVEKDIQDSLAEQYPSTPRLGFRLLYKSELDGGPSKGFLTSVLPPEVLLFDMPYWEHVDGVRFRQEDFSLPIPTPAEAFSLQKGIFEKFAWMKVADIPEKSRPQFLKGLARMIDARQRMRGRGGPFSYTAIMEHTGESAEKAVAQALWAAKKEPSSGLFEKYSPLFQDYIDSLPSHAVHEAAH